jgi:uncharacterized membrane protein
MTVRLAINLFAALAILGGCGTGEEPVLACQQRIDSAGRALSPEDDSFGAAAYEKIDRKGCNAAQRAQLDRVIALTGALPGLNAANEAAATSGDKAAHMAAFQRMNDALIELNAIQQRLRSDLAAMEQSQ